MVPQEEGMTVYALTSCTWSCKYLFKIYYWVRKNSVSAVIFTCLLTNTDSYNVRKNHIMLNIFYISNHIWADKLFAIITWFFAVLFYCSVDEVYVLYHKLTHSRRDERHWLPINTGLADSSKQGYRTEAISCYQAEAAIRPPRQLCTSLEILPRWDYLVAMFVKPFDFIPVLKHHIWAFSLEPLMKGEKWGGGKERRT